MLKAAILDDYQDVAMTVADWSPVKKDVELKTYNKPLGSPDKVIAALKDCEIVCLMRERTLFGADIINSLPKLKLIVTSGLRNAAIDVAAANARGVVVSGTESLGHPTAELTFGLMLELTRRIGHEHARLATTPTSSCARTRNRGTSSTSRSRSRASPAIRGSSFPGTPGRRWSGRATASTTTTS